MILTACTALLIGLVEGNYSVNTRPDKPVLKRASTHWLLAGISTLIVTGISAYSYSKINEIYENKKTSTSDTKTHTQNPKAGL